MFSKSASDKKFHPPWRQICISKLLTKWTLNSFSIYYKQNLHTKGTLTLKSGRENISNRLGVPESCRCAPGSLFISLDYIIIFIYLIYYWLWIFHWHFSFQYIIIYHYFDIPPPPPKKKITFYLLKKKSEFFVKSMEMIFLR